MPDYDDDLSWMDGPEPDYEASQVAGEAAAIVPAPDSREPCPRCAPQIAELQARLQFRPCGYTGPRRRLVRGADAGRQGHPGPAVRPAQVLLSASPAFGVAVLDEEDGPCGWLVPAEEAMGGEQAAPGEVPGEVAQQDLQEVPG